MYPAVCGSSGGEFGQAAGPPASGPRPGSRPMPACSFRSMMAAANEAKRWQKRFVGNGEHKQWRQWGTWITTDASGMSSPASPTLERSKMSMPVGLLKFLMICSRSQLNIYTNSRSAFCHLLQHSCHVCGVPACVFILWRGAHDARKISALFNVHASFFRPPLQAQRVAAASLVIANDFSIAMTKGLLQRIELVQMVLSRTRKQSADME